jgi:hypothetical protein
VARKNAADNNRNPRDRNASPAATEVADSSRPPIVIRRTQDQSMQCDRHHREDHERVTPSMRVD